MARKLSEAHLAQYKDGGKLKTLFDCINRDSSLLFEIRIDNTVKVYYKKEMILSVIYHPRKNDKIEVKMLSPKYYKNTEIPKHCVITSANIDSPNNVENYLKSSKGLIDKWNAETKGVPEFEIQQQIANANRTLCNRYLVVDMEWAWSQAKILPADRLNEKTRIDLVIVDTIRNEKGFNDVYLAELKYGLSATEGKSGIEDHIEKTRQIINKGECCDDLIQDIKSIISQKRELRIITGNSGVFEFDRKYIKMMLLAAYSGKEFDNMKHCCDKAIEYAETKEVPFIVLLQEKAETVLSESNIYI